MGRGFAEVAYLRGDDKKYEENFGQIDWSSHKKSDDTISKVIWKIDKGEKSIVSRYDNLEEYENDLRVLNELKSETVHYEGGDYE